MPCPFFFFLEGEYFLPRKGRYSCWSGISGGVRKIPYHLLNQGHEEYSPLIFLWLALPFLCTLHFSSECFNFQILTLKCVIRPFGMRWKVLKLMLILLFFPSSQYKSLTKLSFTIINSVDTILFLRKYKTLLLKIICVRNNQPLNFSSNNKILPLSRALSCQWWCSQSDFHFNYYNQMFCILFFLFQTFIC